MWKKLTALLAILLLCLTLWPSPVNADPDTPPVILETIPTEPTKPTEPKPPIPGDAPQENPGYRGDDT